MNQQRSDTGDRHTSSERHQIREQVLTQPEPSKVARSANAVVLTHGEIFLQTTKTGDVSWELPHGQGLFYRDTRFLNGFEMRLDDHPLIPLSHDDSHGFRTSHHLANADIRDAQGAVRLAKNTLGVHRQRLVHGEHCHERVTVTNFARTRVSTTLSLRYRSEFEDIFVVRGFMDAPRGRQLPAEMPNERTVHLHYDGADACRRTLTLAFRPAPDALDGSRATFQLELDAGATWELRLALHPMVGRRPVPENESHRALEALERWPGRAETLWLENAASVTTSNEVFDRVLERSYLDLGRLRGKIDGLHYFNAGIPWFATLFGRDSAIAATAVLAFESKTAADTLRLLSRYQAHERDDFRDAEPGKILHELRRGELAQLGVVPHSPAYYGTVDATLLFLILLAEYVAWSGDLDLARTLRPSVDAALGWIDDWGDHDGDGYLDYRGRYANGLINQGWKDAGNSIMDADGRLPEPPIALGEVQGYLYRAWRQTAALFRHLDDAAAATLDRRADDLQRRFERDFWSDDLGGYRLARQAGGRPIDVMSSNAGQVLWSGIATSERATQVAERLLQPDMFSGWGVRTLSSDASAYNPMGYHLGSVWPHDNALILAGFCRYGLAAPALRLFKVLFDAASHFDGFRLPELYCGYANRAEERKPVQYPVACSPQAWAAAAVPYALVNLLGLRPDALAGRLRIVRPQLPEWLESLHLRHVRVGSSVVDLSFRHDDGGPAQVEFVVREGDLQVETTDRLPPPQDW